MKRAWICLGVVGALAVWGCSESDSGAEAGAAGSDGVAVGSIPDATAVAGDGAPSDGQQTALGNVQRVGRPRREVGVDLAVGTHLAVGTQK